MREARIELPFLPPAVLRGNSRAHWAVKARKTREMRESGRYYGIFECIELHNLNKVSVKATFYNFRFIDLDNALHGLKAWFDGCLVDGEIVPDDSPDHVRIEAPEFVKTPKGEERTTIEIREIPC